MDDLRFSVYRVCCIYSIIRQQVCCMADKFKILYKIALFRRFRKFFICELAARCFSAL